MAICFLDANAVKGVREYVNSDPEFKLASQYVVADILLAAGDAKCIVKIREGAISEILVEPNLYGCIGASTSKARKTGGASFSSPFRLPGIKAFSGR